MLYVVCNTHCVLKNMQIATQLLKRYVPQSQHEWFQQRWTDLIETLGLDLLDSGVTEGVSIRVCNQLHRDPQRRRCCILASAEG